MKWSKTIQFRDRAVLILFSFIPNSPLCPVQAIQHVLPHAKDSSQAFNYLDSNTLQPVSFTYTKFLKFLRTCLDNIGCNSSLYAGHSFRRGGASFAFQAGVPVEMIKLPGDWKSDAVLLYLTVPLQMRMTSNNFLTKHILRTKFVQIHYSRVSFTLTFSSLLLELRLGHFIYMY